MMKFQPLTTSHAAKLESPSSLNLPSGEKCCYNNYCSCTIRTYCMIKDSDMLIIGIGSHLEHAMSHPVITTLTLCKLGTYPGGAGGMLIVSLQRECCGQEHGGRGCPHRRSGDCWERSVPAQEHSHASDLQKRNQTMTWYRAKQIES